MSEPIKGKIVADNDKMPPMPTWVVLAMCRAGGDPYWYSEAYLTRMEAERDVDVYLGSLYLRAVIVEVQP